MPLQGWFFVTVAGLSLVRLRVSGEGLAQVDMHAKSDLSVSSRTIMRHRRSTLETAIANGGKSELAAHTIVGPTNRMNMRRHRPTWQSATASGDAPQLAKRTTLKTGEGRKSKNERLEWWPTRRASTQLGSRSSERLMSGTTDDYVAPVYEEQRQHRVSLQNMDNVQYFGEVMIGEPPQLMKVRFVCGP